MDFLRIVAGNACEEVEILNKNYFEKLEFPLDILNERNLKIVIIAQLSKQAVIKLYKK